MSSGSRARLRGAIGFLTAVVVASTFLQVDPPAAVATPVPLPEPSAGHVAPARPAPAGVKDLPDHALAMARKAPAAVAWPAAGTRAITVGAVGASQRTTPVTAQLRTYDRQTSVRAKVDGPVMRVTPAGAGTVKLTVDYASYAHAGGGDFGARLILVSLPECALTTPEVQACAPRPLTTVNDRSTRKLTADVPAAAAGSLVAVTATEGSSQGNYSATSLAPSSQWSVAPSSGGFSWSYPLRVPPVPGGFGPGVSFGYSSQAIDGRTATTNNQGSWIGEGFGYEPGYVERRYKQCSDDGHKTVGDLCWAYDNAVLSLNGSSSELVRTGNTWRLANDDGSKIEKLSGATNGDEGADAGKGEHWKLTTTDGSQYFFGLNRLSGWSDGKAETKSVWTAPVFGDDAANADDKSDPDNANEAAPKEPCYNATFENAYCQQAWRWNLDYAVDRNGNAMAYFYEPEKNAYARTRKVDVNGAAYDRGGYLKRIEYGLRSTSLYTTPAAAKVEFEVAERCIQTVAACQSNNLTKDTQSAWPDVPFDRICATGTKCKSDQVSPTFFTRKRLKSVTTYIRTGASTYTDVDKYTLDHIFPDNGDGSRLLWLHTITQDGVYGDKSASAPAVRLDVKQLPNRIRRDGDMLGEMVRPRLGTVYTDSGSQIDIQYAEPDCTKDNLPAEGRSTRRCFPVKWHGPGVEDVVTDWFHKYVVAAVRETDMTDVEPGTKLPPDMVTFYRYEGDAAWRHAEPDGLGESKYDTWGDWRGYAKVLVSKGDDNAVRTRTRHFYLRGMDGDKNPDGGTRSVTLTDSVGTVHTDSKELLGFEFETQVLDADEKVISKSVNSPWRKQTASQKRSFGTRQASIVRPGSKRGFTALESGGWRETKTVTTYDGSASYPVGRVTQVEDQGDVSVADDDRCSRTTYADNPDRNIRTLVARVETVAVNCSATPNRAKQVIGDTLSYYDDKALGAAPTTGLVTRTERLNKHDGTKATYEKVNEGGYDTYGRPTWTRDAKNAESRIAYVETNGLTTKKTEYSPKIAVGAQTPAEFSAVTEYNPAWGLPARQSDWNGKNTSFAYDPIGRLEKVWLPNRSPNGDPSVKYTYRTEPGKPIAIKTEKAGNSAGVWTTQWQIFDGFLRPRQIQGPGPHGRLVADTWYTSTGQVDRVSEEYAAQGVPTYELLPTLNVDTELQTGYLYDAADRVTDTITFVAGQEKWRSRTYYGGDRTHVQPPQGGVATTVLSDARGNETERWYYKDSTPGPAGHAVGAHDTTRYTYTAAGQLATVTDPDRNVWKYTYDQVGNKTSAEDPDSGTTLFGYDEAGRLIRTEDARHRVVETDYDLLGRVTGTFEVTAQGRVQLTDQDWDEKARGQLFKSARFVNGKQYAAAVMSLDDFYRPLETRYVIPDDAGEALKGTYQFFSSYNLDGTQQGYTLPTTKAGAGEAVVFGYDEFQRVKTVTGTLSPLVTDVKYTDTGEVTRAELNAGKRSTYVSMTYERGTNRLATRSLSREAMTSPSNPQPDRPANDINQSFNYDHAGNVLWARNTPATGENDTQCFTYDHLNRMTDAYSTGNGGDTPCRDSAVGGVAPYHHSYTYDATGNRLTETIHAVPGTDGSERTYAYPDGGRQRPHGVTAITEQAENGAQKLYQFGYDESGNTNKRSVAGEDQILDWDAEGKLASVTNADGAKTTFVYSPSGDRLVRKEPKATTVYLPGLELRLDTTTSVVSDTRYHALPGGVVAVKTAAGLQWQIADRNGTGEAAVDAQTDAIAIRRSTPFGADRGTQPTAAQWAGEKGYVGGTKDTTTGLTHLGAREYDPLTGKFISVDPLIDLSDPQQMNGYAYSNNSPITYSDPGGLKACADDRCGPGADYEDLNGDYVDVEGDNDGCVGDCMTSGDNGGSSGSDSEPAEVKAAKSKAQAAKQKLIAVAKQLGKLLMDELGITDAIDCFTKGDVGGCVNTLLNIAATALGGAVGKLAMRYAARWDKLLKLVKTGWDLVGRLKGAIGDFFASRKALDAAESAATSCVRHSFKAGTLVLLTDGSFKRIEEIDVGDEVVATDPETGTTRSEEVTETHVNLDRELADVTVSVNGDDIVLETTTHHPFWDAGRRQWIPAGELEPETELLSTSGDRVTVSDRNNYAGERTMYDLTVNDIHTYYVLAGNTPVLVHNCGDLPEGYSSSPGLRGDPYHPDEVAKRSRDSWDLYGPSIQDRAAALGYKSRIPAQRAPFNSHGQVVFSDGKNYITPDVDGHNVSDGWKMFNRRGQRIGTYDADLNYLKE
ncbi:polymorphic toxin-type HINT domain-containing protein [Pseudosporangium ferrugineum]|uniref:Intein/RHS repeat-associated protein n=1 Tax=Pseudosporangium ferrugineum TaxID=439699 RepID=A0A2T0S464_9ACTN|nr:polymorphic toxin-type HINT domain-containing protein [Pseudosporangium ferrugineum]PRY28230.1 intein/RHS repeat-associated protein [Pseudosporangium ferrugineum]